MKARPLFLLLAILASGCTALPQLKRTSNSSKSPPATSASPMSQLGVALPAMKAGDDRELKMIAAHQMMKHGYWSEAVALYLEAESMSPKKPKLDAQLAPALAGAGQFSESIQRYRRLIKEDPKNAAIFSNLAFTLMESGDPKAAEVEFRNALSIDPQYENAAVNLGLLLARQRRFEEAIAVLVPAIGEAATHHNLGVIAIECGDDAAARQEFAHAASLPGAPKATQEFLAALDKKLAVH